MRKLYNIFLITLVSINQIDAKGILKTASNIFKKTFPSRAGYAKITTQTEHPLPAVRHTAARSTCRKTPPARTQCHPSQ